MEKMIKYNWMIFKISWRIEKICSMNLEQT